MLSLPCFDEKRCFFPLSSQCSVSCGRGTKQREIACVFQNQTQIKDAHCSHLPRPRAQTACRAQGCPAWKANRWREVCLLFLLLHDLLNIQSGRGAAATNTTETLLEAADVEHAESISFPAQFISVQE